MRGEIETELVDARVLLTSIRGFSTAALCDARREQFQSVVKLTSGAPWIIDTLGLTGFEPAAVTASARWFDDFKQRDGQHILLVSSLGAVRMVAATLAFAVHVKITCCRELAQAYDKADLASRSVRPSEFTLSPPSSKAGQR